jgi:5'-nucleotidase
VTNNFMRGGGDGYAAFLEEGTDAYDYGPNLEDVVADYLARHPGYAPPPADRITRLD